MAATVATSTTDQVIEAFSKLPKGMKLEAFLKIRDMVFGDIDEELEPLTADQVRELDARYEEMQRHPENCISWDDFKAELEARYGKEH